MSGTRRALAGSRRHEHVQGAQGARLLEPPDLSAGETLAATKKEAAGWLQAGYGKEVETKKRSKK
jgi:hypothetical protein